MRWRRECGEFRTECQERRWPSQSLCNYSGPNQYFPRNMLFLLPKGKGCDSVFRVGKMAGLSRHNFFGTPPDVFYLNFYEIL